MSKIDLKNLPELENEKDAYCLDRNGNIGVLHFVGDCDGSHYEGFMSRCYKLGRKLEYIVTNKKFKEIDFFGNDSTKEKNTSVFAMIDPYGAYIQHPYLFIPNKRSLLNLFKDLESFKEYYVIFDTLGVRMKKYTALEAKKYDGVFETEEEAVKYFNAIKGKVYNDLLSLREKTKEIRKIAKSRVIKALPSPSNMSIKAKDAEIGGKYHFKLIEGNDYSKKTVVIDYIDKDGIAHLTNGNVFMPTDILLSDKNYFLLEKIKSNDEFVRTLNFINYFLAEIDKHLKQLSTVTNPFEDKVSSVHLDDMNKTFERLCKYIESDEKLL